MKFSRSVFFSTTLSLALAVSAAAQTLPPDPHAHSAGEDAVFLEDYVVTATPFRRDQADVAAATTILAGRNLQLKRQATLGDTLAGEVGMSATSFGPGASRPLIRGLGGDRVRILENGVGTLDASVTSPDHAVSVEPFLVQRIEVVRGPASLLYGGSAVGGVVNVITHRIETEVPSHPLSGTFDVRQGGGADERSYGAVTDVALNPAALGRAEPAVWVLHLDGFRRWADDLRIPGFAETAARRAEVAEEAREHGEAPPEAARDHLPNSSLLAAGGALGVSRVTSQSALGFAYSGFHTLYGVPSGQAETPSHVDDAAAGDAEEGPVRIDLRQRRFDVQGEWRREVGLVRALKVKAGRAEYRHQELAGGEIGTVFTHRGFDARAELLHAVGRGFEGAWGVQAGRSDFAADGAEAFLPPTVTRQGALFGFEEARTGPITWQAGARGERQTIQVKTDDRERDADTLSASLGAVWSWSEGYALALSGTRTERSPNAQELYSHGPHAGTQSFELGDERLADERSLGAELSLRRKTGWVTGAASLFVHRFDGFIFEQANGAQEDGLPVYRYGQRDANFWGAEVETILHLHRSGGHQWDIRLAGDHTRAEDADGRALPRIPPMKGSLGVAWTQGAWAAGAEVQRVARQGRVSAEETSTPGYTWVTAYANYRFTWNQVAFDGFLRGANLTDAEARVHSSFLKDFAPLAGRNVTGGVRLSF